MARSIHSAIALALLAALLLAGCGASGPAFQPTPTARPDMPALAATPSRPEAPPPERELSSASWQEKHYTVTVHTLSADANLIALGFTVVDEALPATANRDMRWIASRPISLITLDGIS